MNGIFWLDEYQNAVLAELKKIAWAETIGIYPEIPDDFPTPALFFDVSGWERSDRNIGGNVTVELTGVIYILRHFVGGAGENDETQGATETKVRNGALKITDWIHGRIFGPATAPAVLVSAEPLQWESGESAATHAVWGISFNQLLAVGLDPFEPGHDAPKLKEIYLGLAPDIGAGHEADYTLIAREEGQ